MTKVKLVLSATSLFFIFLLIAFEGRSLILLFGLLGAIVLFGVAVRDLSRQHVLQALSGPYIPFIGVTLVVAPFQEKATDAFWLLTIPVSYVLARLLRLTVPAKHLAMGIALLGLFLGGVIAFGRGPVGEVIGPLDDLAHYLHKNVFGWIAALGLVMALYLLAFFADKVLWQAAFGGLFAVMGVLLFFTGSMTGFLGGAATLAVVSGVLLVRAFRKKQLTRGVWWDIAPLGLGVLMALVFFVVNLVGGGSDTIADLAERDSSLTGRTGLWLCYLDGLLQTGAVEERVRTECVSMGHSNLHNSFLESFSIGGFLLAGALLVSFAWAIIQGGRTLWSGSDKSSRTEARFALAIAVLGFLIALVESYIYSRHVYVSLVLFLGPMVTNTPPRWAHTRLGRFLLGKHATKSA